MKARRDTTTEAFEVLCDLTLTPYEALTAAQHLMRRWTGPNAAFVRLTGWHLRAIKAKQRFESDQLSRWAGEGGYEP